MFRMRTKKLLCILFLVFQVFFALFILEGLSIDEVYPFFQWRLFARPSSRVETYRFDFIDCQTKQYLKNEILATIGGRRIFYLMQKIGKQLELNSQIQISNTDYIFEILNQLRRLNYKCVEAQVFKDVLDLNLSGDQAKLKSDFLTKEIIEL